MGLEFIAELVGASEVTVASGFLALVEEGDDFRRCAGFSLGGDGEDRVDAIPGGEGGGGGFWGEVITGELPVPFADLVEDDAPGLGDIEVVIHGGGEGVEEFGVGVGGSGAGDFAEFEEAVVESGEGGRGAGEVFEREVKRFAVVGLEEEVADIAAWKAFGGEVGDGEEVAERFAHLFTFDEEVCAVDPGMDAGFAGLLEAGAFALGDFVFVMWEDEVFAAEVEVEAGAEQFHAHGAALDVPAGPAFAPRAGPVDLAVVIDASFPEGEVGDGVFGVFVVADAFAWAHGFEVEVKEAAVLASHGAVAIDAEVDGFVGGLVGEAAFLQALDEVDDVLDVFGGAGHGVWARAAEEVHVGEEGLLQFPGELGEGGLGFPDAANDFVFDVGDIHDVEDIVAAEFEVAAEEVGEDERAEVPDVGAVIDRGAAAVHADLSAFGVTWDEGFHGSGKRIKQADSRFLHRGVDHSGVGLGFLVQSSEVRVQRSEVSAGHDIGGGEGEVERFEWHGVGVVEVVVADVEEFRFIPCAADFVEEGACGFDADAEEVHMFFGAGDEAGGARVVGAEDVEELLDIAEDVVSGGELDGEVLEVLADLGEQPGVTDGAAADHEAEGAGGLEDGVGFGGGADVAIGEDGAGEGLGGLADEFVAHWGAVHFVDGAAVDREEVEVMFSEDGDELVEDLGGVEPDAGFDGESGCGDGIAQGAEDGVDLLGVAEEAATGAFAVDHGCGAAEVEVDGGDGVILEFAGGADEFGDVVTDELGDGWALGWVMGNGAEDAFIEVGVGIDAEVFSEVEVGATVGVDEFPEFPVGDVLHGGQRERGQGGFEGGVELFGRGHGRANWGWRSSRSRDSWERGACW